MSNNVLNPLQQFKDDAGNPLTSGSLTFTDDGTNDANTEVFSDEALTVQVVTAAGVYVLDAAGRTRGDVIFKGRRRMTLKNAAGAKIRVYDAVVSSSSVANTTEYELGSVVAVHTHTGIITGHIINVNFKDTNRTLGSGGSFRHDGSTDITKAGNWPDADGFNYDADGKKFVEVSQSETLTSPDGNTAITLANGTITIKISSTDSFVLKKSAMFLIEQAAALSDIAAYGQYWVESTTPNIARFTDDAGTGFFLQNLLLDSTTPRTSAFTAVVGKWYLINTTGGSFNITMPDSPTGGKSAIGLHDYAGTFAANPPDLIQASSGDNIIRADENGKISINNFSGALVMTDATNGWEYRGF